MPLLSLLPYQQPYAGVDREAIWSALFTHFQLTLAGYFQVMSRKHVMPPSLPSEMQPAFFLVQIKEGRSGSLSGVQNKLVLHGFLIVYLVEPGTNDAPGSETELASTELNQIFQAIDDALVPDNYRTGKFTLNGLVTHCWIEGEVEQDPGLFTSQAAAILPIHILVP